MTCGDPTDPTIFHRITFVARRLPRRLRKKQLPSTSHWSGPKPTTPSTHSQSVPTVSRYSRQLNVGRHYLRSLINA